MSSLFEKVQQRQAQRQTEELTLNEYLDRCKTDSSYYANAAERMLKAIGDPEIVDTRKDERMSRIFQNRKIKVYPKAFSDFYGLEDTIESIVSFFKHAAQGLEESKQVLYLLGPVGGGKSSLSERLKELMQRVPFYTIKAFNKELDEWQISPCYESPLGLFDAVEDSAMLEAEYNIPKRYVKFVASPWATKRLNEVGGDITQFKVVRVWPSVLQQIGITKVEPGDENNQDISSLVGKINIRQLEEFNQNDPDAYNWAGGLNVTTQGIMEFVEMFKAPIKMLHPMLTATQEGHYNGTEQFSAIPYQGIILAHSNESEWQAFRNDRKNEAFLDRVNIIKVPYCLRVTEEVEIYRKLIDGSTLKNAPCAPGTLEMMAQYSVLTRIKDPENSNVYTKLEVYDGKHMKNKDPKVKSLEDYREAAGINEGMDGSSTRFAYKILSKVYNHDSEEVAANPIILMHTLEKQIKLDQLPQAEEERRITFIKGQLAPRFADFIGDELQKAYLESYDEYGQNLFDRYIQLSDYWLQEKDYKDVDTGEMFDRAALNAELDKIEKPAGIANPKEFRNEVVNFVLRASRNQGGKNPKWTSYEKLREVIEKKMFASTEDLLPVISFSKKATEDEEKKHAQFVGRMKAKGYTEKQIRLSVEWFIRYRRHN
jgi:serine protein kinase